MALGSALIATATDAAAAGRGGHGGGGIAADTSAVPWGAVVSVAAWPADTSEGDASPVDSNMGIVRAAWPSPLGTMTIHT